MSRTIVVFVKQAPDLQHLIEGIDEIQYTPEGEAGFETQILKCGTANQINDNIMLVDGPRKCSTDYQADYEGTDIAAYLSESGWLTEITVPAIGGERVHAAALKLGQKICAECNGVLADDWADKLWPAKPKIKKRRKRAQPRIRRVDIVSFVWFFALSNSIRSREEETLKIHDELVGILQTTLLPEASPPKADFYIDGNKSNKKSSSWSDFRKIWQFGANYGMQHKMRFYTKSPLIEGRMEFSDPRRRLETPKNMVNYVRVDLNFDLDAFADEAWTETVVQAFSKINDSLPTIYASSFLFKDARVKGAWLSTHEDFASEPMMSINKGWTGLPNDNGWMFWLPNTYDERLTRSDHQEPFQPTVRGILFRLSEKPSVSEDVREHFPNFPSDLYFEPKLNEEGRTSWASKAAKTIPKYKSFL